MKMSFSLIIDVCFSAFIMFILTFVLTGYFIERRFAIAFSIILSIPVAMIAFKKITKKKENDKIKKSTQEKIDEMNNELSLYSQPDINDLFFRAFCKAGYTPLRKNGGIFINGGNDVVLIRYGESGAKKTDVLKAFNLSRPNGKAYLIAQTFSAELLSFIDRFNGAIISVDDKKVYEFLDKLNFLPTPRLPKKTVKTKKERLKIAFFNRKKAKKFFLFGLLFLFMSLFTNLKLYYIICGSISLIYSLTLRLFGRNV